MNADIMNPEDLKSIEVSNDPNMDMIIPGLYLGNSFSQRSESHLQKYGITHILSVTHTKYVAEGLLERKSIKVEDSLDADLMVHFAETNAYISNALKQGGVLVHCLMGISRSATVVAAYLMATQGLSYKDAVAFVKSRRPVVSPNFSFIRQLELYGKPNHDTSSWDGGPASGRRSLKRCM